MRNKIGIDKIFVMAIIGIFLVSTFPLLTGDVMLNKTQAVPFSSYIKIPDYWCQASNYLNSQKDNFKVLLLPGDDYYQVPYTWDYYGADALPVRLIDKPTIQQISGGYTVNQEIINLIYGKIAQNETQGFASLLSLLNIKYILQRNDVFWNSTGRTILSPEAIKSFLSNATGIQFVRSFGELDLYKVSDDYILPQIYPTITSVLVNGFSNVFSSILSSDSSNNTAFFSSTELNSFQNGFIQNLDNTILVNTTLQTILPQNGSSDFFNWSSLNNGSAEIRYFYNWKTIINTDGTEIQDILSFPSLSSCPYQFPGNSSTSWAAFNSTIIYIKTGNEPLNITQMYEDQQPITDIVGIWWQTGWEGMGTKPEGLPIEIPPNQEAIIQINHIITRNVTFENFNNTSFNVTTQNSNLPKLTYEEVNPAKYVINVQNATQPFFIVFGESYDPQWKAYVTSNEIDLNGIVANYPNYNVKNAEEKSEFTPQDISYLFSSSINGQLHFMTDGYANSWYINPQQLGNKTEFTITIYYLPQSYYYLGLAATGITLVIFAGVIIYELNRFNLPIKKRLKTVLAID